MATARIIKWRRRTKRRAVNSLGGCCCVCEYRDSFDALVFHHVEKKGKSIASMLANPTSWSRIVKELRKCVCLCNRCHSEVHDEDCDTVVPPDAPRFDEEYAPKPKEKNFCMVCGKEIHQARKTCSYTCAGRLSWRVNWNEVSLSSLLKTKNVNQIARQLDVSWNAVAKRMKREGLTKNGM